ncbi:MAG: diadenylate cyclase CdaA [Bacteroidales bacterium]|jgi:diadenylate cyclase|nr:diadenylate cyclase CdaA [Bacteroidales bacterium]MDI9592640.1 diadenylate cyclase CdaA [Bacteroidota bacterium]OQC37075.1 MAG: DNA integrity scanning protein DisA [Bacteroidetes bacterium ADurb.Bin041]MBP7873848.1 diadenylate cyclase CdaA [Bacteroidales bacterium]MCO6467839.1 diadenylate cyclase CdaA [Bacteroidales bacterium]
MANFFITAFIQIKLADLIDILLVAVLIYMLYNLLKGTAATNILIGIFAIFIFWRVVLLLEMEMLSQILGAFISVGFIALIVVFQPEIRQFLLLIGTPRFLVNMRRRFGFLKFKTKMIFILDVDPIVSACRKMSVTKTGALIVIARLNELQQYTESGQVIDAAISEDLILNLFFKNSPLHDGAVIVLNNRIRSARVILPVSGNQNLPGEIGLRHRAALGITEKTDAVAIVVSEEAGYISCFQRGNVKLNITPSQLKNFLDSEFNLEEKTEK